MNLSQLIKTNNWLSVKLTLISLYPNQAKSINAYESVYTNLLQIQFVESDVEIVLKNCKEEGEEDYVGVSGIKISKMQEEKQVSYALEFRP